MRYTALILALAFALVSGPSSASTKELEAAIFQAIPWENKRASLSQRQAMAEAVLAYWKDFDSRLPRLSPKENEWVEQEAATQGDRLTRLFNSKEFALYQLGRHVDMCLRDVNSVLEAESDQLKNSTEMFFWVKLLNCYTDLDDMRIYLNTASLSNGKYDGPFYMVGGSLILERIINNVIPAAMADTMGWTLTEQ